MPEQLLTRSPIHITHLSLIDFRNYEGLKLDLEPGMVLIQGRNGQGKSNLLEALYMLAIAKSPRALTDREVIRWQAAGQDAHTQLAAIAQRQSGTVRVQIDFVAAGNPDQPALGLKQSAPVRRHLKVNGVSRRTSDVVGEINAVMFGAPDLDLVLGPPVVRRRYLDILTSQIEHTYLTTLQRYQRVVSQRNHLLKSLREDRSKAGELEFWDDELAASGGHLMARRAETVLMLSREAAPAYRSLADGGDGLQIRYRPSVEVEPNATEEDIRKLLKTSMYQQRDRELAQGFTVFGPHRDDLQMLLGNIDAATYASRGECRTVALAMKLAEASYLKDRRGQEPILLLDDVLSELDEPRRAHVLERAVQFQQCFITTTDVEQIDNRYLSRTSRFAVSDGQVTPMG